MLDLLTFFRWGKKILKGNDQVDAWPQISFLCLGFVGTIGNT